MNFTAKNRRSGKLGRAALVFALVLGMLAGGLCATAGAEADTTLTVQIKGVTYDGTSGWRSVTLSAPVRVLSGDGQTLGQVTAGADDNTLTLSGVTEVVLQPVEKECSGDFVFAGESRASVTEGESNLATVFAYAKQGFFSVKNTMAGTGAAVGGAEYAVLDGSGAVKLSFTMDETGVYRSTQALPNGEYRLAQMRAAAGTLPMSEPVAFTVGTFFGNDQDIAAITIQSEPVPEMDASVGQLRLNADGFAPAQDGQAYTARVTVDGLCDGTNNLPLSKLSMTLSADGLRDSMGGECGGVLTVESVSVRGADSVQTTVQGLDKSGVAIGAPLSLANGQAVALPEGVYAAVVRYGSGTDALPEGFQAGGVAFDVRYVAAVAEQGVPELAAVSAWAELSGQYPDVDGAGVAGKDVKTAPAGVEIPIPDGRRSLSFSAVANGNTVILTAQAENGVESGLPVLIALPDGARVNEQEARYSALLRGRMGDTVAVTLGDLADGYTLPLSQGDVTGVTVFAADPCGMPRTERNPFGASLTANGYRADALLDTLLGRQKGVYAAFDCALEGEVRLGTGEPYGIAAASGSVKNAGGSTEEASGLLLNAENSNIYYGTAAEADGSFTIWMPKQAEGGMRLLCMLPENTRTAEGGTGLFETDITLPVADFEIVYAAMACVTGKVCLPDGTAVPGVSVALLQNGRSVSGQQTDAAGAFRFTGLSAGDYALTLSTVGVSGAVLVADQGSAIDGDTLTTAVFALSQGETLSRLFEARGVGEVRCSVTADGLPVSGAAVALTDATGARVERQTGSDGIFVFENAEYGTAALTVMPPDGMAVLAINGESVNASGVYEAKLEVSAGAANEQRIELVRAASIAGSAPALGGGQPVSAASAFASAKAETSADGSFRFDGLAPGDYSVYVPLPEGKTLEADSEWRVTKQGDMLWITVSAQAGGECALPGIAFVTMTSIEGCAYVDGNGDRVRGDGEQLLTGVPVALQRSSSQGWEDVADTHTDEYGQYAFTQLEPGEYRVASKTDAKELCVVSIGESAESVGDSGVICGSAITLGEGDRSVGKADIGLGKTAALTFTAFSDSNGDGARGERERAVAGVTVEVMSGERAIASGVTDMGGGITLEGVRPGAHALRVTLPDGYVFTVKGASPEQGDSCVGGTDDNVAVSAPFTFVSGQTVTAGVGVKPAGSLGGKVFEDMNNNGVMDEGEPGVAGVTLHLTGKKTGVSYDLTTGDTGEYRFINLPNDTYVLTADLPQGMLFARYSRTGGDLRSIFSGSTTAREFQVKNALSVTDKNVGVVQKGAIRGTVFLDTNYNGVFDEGEPGFEGVTLEAIKISNSESMGRTVSGKDGGFVLEGLRGGDYRLRAILPDSGTIFTVVPANAGGKVNLFEQRGTRRENSIQPITIESGGEAEALVGVAVGASVSGTVFQDADYNGRLNGKEKKLSGVKVTLVDEGGTVAATATTNAEGKYTLSGIMPGTYTVQFQRKAGYGFTRLRPDEEGGSHVTVLEGEYGVTAAMQIAMGQAVAGVNAGMLPSSTVTGVLFHDEDDNGLRGAEEQGMVGASVRLLSEDGEIDLTKQIGQDGAYFFDGVMPGKYTLTYSLPEHVELARVTEGGNTLKGQGRETVTAAFNVAMGEAYQCPLVGAVTLGSFKGYVFHDINANGVPDEGEERMAGAAVTLTPDHAGAQEVSVVSAADGSFVAEGLRPAGYQLTVKLPDGYIFSHDLDQDGLSLDADREITVNCSWRILTNRLEKAIGAVKPATVSGVLWLDENKDGSRGGGEMLLSGVNLELVDESTTRVVGRTISDGEGFHFENVRPGSYTVRFALPSQSEPADDRTSTFALDGAAMQNRGVVVSEGGAVSGLTTGLVSRTSIAGRVWLDENGQSIPIAGVTVMLFAGGELEPMKTVVTSEDGSYRFDGLWPADYHLQASLPNGLVFVRPDDANYQAGASVIAATGEGVGTSEPFYLQMAQHMLAQNIIFIKPAKVGDQVWLDENKNGLIDGGEPMIPGVKVSLMYNGQEAYQTTTDAYGYYLFEDVYPGTYTLAAQAYPELGITKPVAELRMISSCLVSGDGSAAQSEPFAVESGSVNVNYDLGYVLLDGQSMPDAIQAPPAKDWSVANQKYSQKK